MIALINQVPSETKIKARLRNIIFGKHLYCPRCHTREVYVYEDRYRCRRCRRPFSMLSGTWLANKKVSYRTLWAICWCYTQRVPVLQAQSLCHLSEEAVRRWYGLFRQHLPILEPILMGKVQMDEAYFRNISLVMAKQMGSRSLAHRVLAKGSVDKTDAANFLFQYVAPRSRLQTDGVGIYKAMHRWWPIDHRVDIHRKFEFGLTSEIEGMFGNLRTFIRRMYHHVTPEYLPELVGEFCLRFSHPEIFNSPFNFLQKTLRSVPFD